jgi:RNA polymerase sigma-70 factor (ECF subfamily)
MNPTTSSVRQLEGAELDSSPGAPAPPTSALEGATAEPFEMGYYAADLKRRALLLTRGDASRASDLVQDTFERALRNLHRLAPHSNIRAWLYTIMVRRFRDLLREDRVRCSGSYDEDLLVAQEVEPPPSWSALSTAEIRAALLQIKPVLRDAFERREFGRHSYQQIAGELGVPVATVGTRISRAREQLRAILLGQIERTPGKGEE